MPITNDTPTTFTCVDPMGTRFEPKETETAGTVVGGVSGYFTTHKEEVAAELQEKYPHMLVTRHETSHAGKATRAIMWTVPEMPWKRNVPNGTKKEQQEANHQQGAIDSREVNENAIGKKEVGPRSSQE